MNQKLVDEEIEKNLTTLTGWKREDQKWIVKKYRFSKYLDGIEFVNRAAQIAEEMNHHPFISIDYKLITLRLTTWNAGGLTGLDFKSAEEFDEEYSHFT
ncbi:4a-hydroxytetrahydrobiopterin dehydratase [Chengkuizengella axinellae]|uniref:4a-hydroxytetrahydrobiopterin dehydratase n=1 Tax=Chengkuizengella axinellae TaxID=3064388 RepID=A0ABT9J1G8_9BACL|nr:4a-hydroxytetrahydrobiopterin dehydratase [Chengkuizengella sp. 2205SS18-9]MDP5275452.1 4a-hydroxytetrahydrobiopterin dehydratase [Chengkuizengella sp. 2205SS18-9]